MERKELQEQRMKGFFIKATKEILKSEGLKGVSVRNIAERAGYSFATIYNYFKDAKDLVSFCVIDFSAECEAFIATRTVDEPRGALRLKAIINAYLEYFVQYPGIFELFFLEKFSDISSNPGTSELIVSFTDRLCAAEWEYLLQQKQVTPEGAFRMKEDIRNGTTGLLLLYLNRRHPRTYDDFYRLAQIQLEGILSGIRR